MRDPSSEEPGTERAGRGGFALPLDVIVAPARAFRAIQATREWLPAYMIIVALSFLELYLIAPVLTHLAAVESKGAAGEAASRAALVLIMNQVALGTIGPLLMAAFAATMLSAGSLGTGGGLARFATFFSLALNCAVPYAIGGVLTALAVHVHDPAGFRSSADLVLATPSLASLRPHGQPREIAFLGYWDPFTLWSLLLIGYGFAALGKVRPVPALLFALAIGLSVAVLQASQFQ